MSENMEANKETTVGQDAVEAPRVKSQQEIDEEIKKAKKERRKLKRLREKEDLLALTGGQSRPRRNPGEKREPAIEVKDLNVYYKMIDHYSIKQMLFKRKRPQEEFHAVKDVSFTVPQGEIWGIIGRNGCGKSTTLNAIAGIFAPNSGTIDLHGHSVSLLSIGVGFNRQISGRENIVLSGMLLGFEKDYVQSKMDEIIEFSELGDFIDKPVRTYSSGMYSKLAFSVTAILETEIMLIDEVLSVGDEHFRLKSLNKMKELISDETRTVVIVSHSIITLKELCDQVIWMDHGEIVSIGDPEEILPAYKKAMV